MEIQPSTINIVTEHKENYKLVSLSLLDCYNGLNPPLLSKISHVIFNLIISNKLYRKPDNKYYSLEEDRRIYSNIACTPEIILEKLDPAKYNIENKGIKNDISNLVSKLQELDDNNIFYIWRYKQPYSYVFLMERDIGCWRYYNSSAIVTPKTLNKIVRSGKCIIDTMVRLEEKRERSVNKQDIERSFGNFLNKMIDKMNPTVGSELSKWIDTANIYDYFARLSSELRAMNDFNGQILSSDFLNRLPSSVKDDIMKKPKNNLKETKETKEIKEKNMLSMEMELIPQDENLIRKKRQKRIIPSKISENSSTPLPVVKRFQIPDPFSNPLNFTKYYKSVIRSQSQEAKFFDAASEVSYAAQVMDTLTQNNREKDSKFLKMWILNYFSIFLKGKNITNPNKTSIKEFMDTFSTFNGNYYG